MKLFKKPKYLLMIVLASLTFVTFVPQFSTAEDGGYSSDNAAKVEAENKDFGSKAEADDGPNWLAEKLGLIVYYLAIKFPSVIIRKEIELFGMVGPYNGFTTQPQIVKAWTTVRDLANMFFILVLLIMSFGTILNLQGYGYRQLLSKLLLMAILINFSKSFVAILIDFSQIVTLTFLAPVLASLGANVIVAMGLQNIMNIDSAAPKAGGEGGKGPSSLSYLVAMILGGIMMIVTMVVLGVILIMFVMRVIGLWIIVILAPLAFLARTFPLMSKYYGQWESELSKNLTLGPGLAFFMWLAFSIVGSGTISSDFKQGGNTAATNTIVGNDAVNFDIQVSKAADTGNMLNFIIAISLLMAGLKFASASGVAGASLAGKASTNLQKTGSRLARGATIGAAAGAGMLAWKGTSGEGGLKGGLGQVSGNVGKSMVTYGDKMGIGALQRGGMNLTNKEDKRRQRKKDYFAKRLEGMSPDEKEKYLATYGQGILGQHELGAREAAGLSQKNKLDRGIEMAGIDPRDMSDADRKTHYGTEKLEEIDQSIVNERMAARAKEMAADFERSGDKASLEKLQSRHASVATTDSVRQIIDEKDVSALARMNFAEASDEIIDLVLSQESKALGEMVDKMDEKKRDAFMQVIQARKAGVGYTGSIDNDKTQAGKAFVLQTRFANERTGMSDKAAVTASAGVPAQAAITNSVTRQYEELKARDSAKAAIARDNVERASTGAQMARISRHEASGHVSLYDDVTGITDDTKFNEVARSATTSRAPAATPRGAPAGTAPISRAAQLAANRVEHGNIESAMANSTTRRHVTEDQVHAHISPEVRTLTSASDEFKKREQFAKEHLGKAREYFGGEDYTGTTRSVADIDRDFKTFVEALNIKELPQLNSKDLKAILPSLHPDKQKFIKENVL